MHVFFLPFYSALPKVSHCTWSVVYCSSDSTQNREIIMNNQVRLPSCACIYHECKSTFLPKALFLLLCTHRLETNRHLLNCQLIILFYRICLISNCNFNLKSSVSEFNLKYRVDFSVSRLQRKIILKNETFAACENSVLFIDYLFQ